MFVCLKGWKKIDKVFYKYIYTDATVAGRFFVTGRAETAIGAGKIETSADDATGRQMGRLGAFVDVQACFPVVVQFVAFGAGAFVAAGHVDAGVRASAIIRCAFVDIYQ